MILYFHGIGDYGLLEPDEGRYSEIPREMLETGDFNTPRLNYVKYFEKPVLFYWLNALSFTVFGENEFAARFPTALFAFLSGVLVFFLARSIYGERTALFSCAILLTMLLHLGVGQINIIDMTLSFFMTMSLVGFWFQKYWVFYLGMALALLSKGLIGIILPGGIVFWYLVLSRQWSVFKDILTYWKGIILFFAVSLPWFIAVCSVNGDFFYFFFIQEHFLRYATKMHDRYEPVWFFIPILILGLLPWVGFLPQTLRGMFNIKGLVENKDRLFLFVWFLLIFIFFSISNSKLIPYIVPLLPPLAVLFGRQLDMCLENEDFSAAKSFMVWSVPILLLIAAASVIYPFFDRDNIGIFKLWSYTLPLGGVSLLFLSAGFYFLQKKNMKFFVAGLLICALLFSMTAKRGFALMGETRSGKAAAELISQHINDGDMIAQVWDYEQGLPFYLKQRIILVDSVGELAFGAAQEKDPKWFINIDKLPELLTIGKGGKKLFLVTDEPNQEKLEDILASYDVKLPEPLGNDGRNVVYLVR